MNGIQDYNKKIIDRCVSIIKNNSDKDFLEDYFNYLYYMEKSSIYTYLVYLINFLNYVNKDIYNLSLNDYTKYMVYISDKTSSYQLSVYASLKKFEEYLHESGIHSSNYMEKVHRPSSVESDETLEKRNKGFLEKEEISLYLKRVNNGAGTHRAIMRQLDWKERDELIILLFLNTGIRCSGLYKLDLSSIDYNKKMIIVRDKRNKRHEYIISDILIDKIKNWINKRAELLQGKEENALFISNRRERMTQAGISKIVKKYSEDIKGKNITPHKLRATYGTQLYEATKDVYFVQTCMGHSSPQTTERYIRGKNTSNKEKASNIMNSLTLK